MRICKIIPLILLLFVFSTASAAVDTQGHWAEEQIAQLEADGIMTGDGTNFMPDRNITRAEFVTAVIRMMGINPTSNKNLFSDVARDSVYTPYISYAAEIGIVSGYDDGTFRPYNPLTREESVVILSRAFGFLSGYNIGTQFSDYVDITDGAKDAFAFALRKGIITGYPDKTLRPRATLTRAEAAVLLVKADKIEATEPGFVMGYPRLEKKGKYGAMRLEVCTNMPCNIYYTLNSADMPGTPALINVNKLLTTTTQPNKHQTADIIADSGKAYNIYLVAVTPDGKKSNIVKIANTTPLPYYDGDGTVENPYGIYTAEQLEMISFFNDRAFVLKNDITLTGEWEPIDDFRGSLDGAGHMIDGLYINTDDSYAGLFRRVTKGEIKNLTVNGQVSAKANAGIFAGEFLDAKITSCVASGRVGAVTNNAGGFFGESAGRIENCLSGVYIVEAGSFAGGIAGQNYGSIRNSISAAYTVVADIYAGGIASVNVGGKIENNIAASVHVYDMLLGNCGRITTSKQDAVVSNNYAYSGMITTSESGINELDNDNGADLTWEELIDRQALCRKLQWDEELWTGGGRGERYLIMRPQGTKEPNVLAGTCEYAPIRVSSAEELLGMISNPDMHYLLVDNIYFGNNLRWSVAADTALSEEGFSGTLDGGGNTIYNLDVQASETGYCGLIGTISSGTVRNLSLSSPKYTNGKITGAIAAVNYGTIENCNVDGMSVDAQDTTAYIGGISGYNYGTIRSTVSGGEIYSDAKNTVAGGICAHNEGFIDDTAFKGSIKTIKQKGVSESVAGGICGYNSGGMIYNAYASAEIRQQATTIYGGGICAIQSDGELYKCSSRGNLIAEQPGNTVAIAYSGGISGLAAGGIVMHSFSDCDIKQYTLSSYAGGICGYNEAAIVQSGYATGSLLQFSDAELKDKMPSYAGGICGYNEAGIVVSTVAVNRDITSYGIVGRVCAGGTKDQAYSNFAAKMNIATEGDGAFGGTTLPDNHISYEYFTMPLSDGGVLGWSKEIWTKPTRHSYKLPVLLGVRNQEVFR